MQLCPVLVSVLFRHQQVSYANIKLWWKFQNVTQFLWRAALHFLIFELSINKSRRAGSPIEVSLIFQQNNRTYTISQCIRYQLCCFLSSKIFKFLHPHCTAECDCWQKIGETHIKHMMALRLFLHCRSAVYELLWIRNRQYLTNRFDTHTVCCFTLVDTPLDRFMDNVTTGFAEHAHQLGCVNMWVKIFQRIQQLQESACCNQQVVGDLVQFSNHRSYAQRAACVLQSVHTLF